MKPFKLFSLLIFVCSCTQLTVSKSVQKTILPNTFCETIPVEIKHHMPYGNAPWQRTINLPTSGKFVEENHYVTSADQFDSQSPWPKTIADNIEQHLQRGFLLYQSFDPKMTFEKLYSKRWNKEWTPEEGGYFGQGSVGEVQRSELTAEDEMWLMTMMWTSESKPNRGTKFLLTANNKSVVVIAGYETGPSSKDHIGGTTREVHAWLGTDPTSLITVGLLKNQGQKTGPVDCK
ncbi:hypothetical protein ACV07N_05345 [Roseivirga echinicomitans]